MPSDLHSRTRSSMTSLSSERSGPSTPVAFVIYLLLVCSLTYTKMSCMMYAARYDIISNMQACSNHLGSPCPSSSAPAPRALLSYASNHLAAFLAQVEVFLRWPHAPNNPISDGSSTWRLSFTSDACMYAVELPKNNNLRRIRPRGMPTSTLCEITLLGAANGGIAANSSCQCASPHNCYTSIAMHRER